MILKTLPYSPFEEPRMARLIILERHLRRKSYGECKLADYSKWLEQAHFSLPSRRTLYEDLRRYADFCDDISYHNGSKILRIDSKATHDATRWLMGEGWLHSPLKPRLLSATLRCLLLAEVEQREVYVSYRQLRRMGKPWSPRTLVGKVLRIVPGSDSGYLQLQQRAEPKRITLNMTRLERAKFTGESTAIYPPEPLDEYKKLMVFHPDKHLIERLRRQYAGFKENDENTLILLVPESQQLMTTDLLEAHLRRTENADPVQRLSPDQSMIGEARLEWL
ncbi:hypothetical protein [Thioflexithrix psekupsensis]|uniref:WYL domain-containing protein n=1 Tax=Thioflexithrix psekupsensis TaxID=1570016 RepID=A0A251XB28_9GAMM|nr:hypothetical protein [Thioflexithrix psekupsensis]OUD15641.1 hypothetical protein TPSD3_03735 [Thioflexithrix psekupsensis]